MSADWLQGLDRYLHEYVDITENNGDGMSGRVVEILPPETRDGVIGRVMVVDYGYGWFVHNPNMIKIVADPDIRTGQPGPTANGEQ